MFFRRDVISACHLTFVKYLHFPSVRVNEETRNKVGIKTWKRESSRRSSISSFPRSILLTSWHRDIDIHTILTYVECTYICKEKGTHKARYRETRTCYTTLSRVAPSVYFATTVRDGSKWDEGHEDRMEDWSDRLAPARFQPSSEFTIHFNLWEFKPSLYKYELNFSINLWKTKG